MSGDRVDNGRAIRTNMIREADTMIRRDLLRRVTGMLLGLAALGGSDTIPAAALYRAMPDLCHHLYVEKSYPGLFDNAKVRTVVPDYRARISLRRGLEALIESWKRDGLQTDPEKDALEDRLVAAAEAFGESLAAAADSSE